MVAVEIMPRALDVLNGWHIAAAFTTGGVLYLVAQALIERRSTTGGRMWLIYLAIATDLFGDGLMIGAGTSIGSGVGLVLAIGQILADIPEGAAATMTFRANDVPRRRRLWLSAAAVLPVLTGAALSFLLLRGRPEGYQLAALVGTAGLFTVAAFEDMIQEAHESDDDSKTSSVALLLGFAVFTIASTALG
ncbi:ZIP family metal transporter [Euzebya sp.]|uniref:ZIP family metal transporter n=1 Tax=Euzebya sp. TaxID=1971409 RepID=UPI00351121B1